MQMMKAHELTRNREKAVSSLKIQKSEMESTKVELDYTERALKKITVETSYADYFVDRKFI